MSMHRIDFADTDVGFVHAQMAPLHEPVIRPDTRACGGYACRQGRGKPCKNGCQSVPLKQQRVQVDPVDHNKFDFEDSDLPASCSDIATAGEIVMTWLGVLVIVVFALLGLAHVVSGLMKYLETAV